MGYPLRSILPVAASLLLVLAAPAAAAEPRAKTAAQRHAEVTLGEAAELRDGRGVRTGRELTDALREVATSIRHLRGEDRERAMALLSRPTDANAPADEEFDRSLPVATRCSASFCVHFVRSGTDAATDANAAAVLAEAEAVRAFENGTLGWRRPPSDGDARVDIYLKELSEERLFGFAATDPNQETQSQHSYLVIDNDFAPSEFNGVPALDSLRITLAHEYGHVLQYGYDVAADGWHYESSAVWLEQRMYPALDDWLRFVHDGASAPGWRSLTELPLTAFDDPRDQPRNAKPYGSVVWNQFLSMRYGSRGDQVQRAAWELSRGTHSPSTRAYDTAIKAAGGSSLGRDFAEFAAAAAEWRVPAAGFGLPERLPEVERLGTLAVDGAAITPRMDHLTFGLYDVPGSAASRIRLTATFPSGTHGALALVARGGPGTSGAVTTRLTELPSGGTGGVTLERPNEFLSAGGRITAVLVNADSTHRGYATSDWDWSRDGQTVAARVTTDATGPALDSRSPTAGATGVGMRTPVRVTFSKSVSGVDERSFSLRAPDGSTVPAAVSYAAGSRTAVLTPASPLADTTRYTVHLTDAIADGEGAGLAPVEWRFTTVRRTPRGTVSIVSREVRALRLLLRSRDSDRLHWSARLVAGGRTVARRRGTIQPGASRIVRVPARGRRRARLVVELIDPQANRARFAKTVRIPAR